MGSTKKKNKNKLRKENNDDDSSTNVEETSDFVDRKAEKRLHTENDSDTEEIPKKIKKKKKPNVDETTGTKNKKSIRQMKREKVAQRQAEAQTAARDKCLNYLSQWKHDRQNWKFMKAKQVWLYKNKFSTQLVPDESWQIFIEYFESARGNIKKRLLDDANKIINEMDEWTETHDKDGDTATSDAKKPDESIYSRARSLIQCLQE